MKKLTSWDEDPIASFSSFVFTDDFARTSLRQPADLILRTISTESAKTYIFMFGNFVKWMVAKQKTLSTITQFDLLRFINRTENGKRLLNSKIAFRYLRLIERCYDHLGNVPNPARLTMLTTAPGEFAKDAAGRSLSSDQLLRFFDALPSASPRRRQKTAFDGWKRRRDRAMQVVMALAGLRVSEAVGLLLEEVGKQVEIDGAIELTITPDEKHDTSYEHVTLLPRAGVDELHPWLRERDLMKIPGHFVFPANMAGDKMTKKTVYVQIRSTFARAGLDLSRSGGRTLRNTFAKRQLENGTLPDDLKDILGLALERSAADYKFTQINEDKKK